MMTKRTRATALPRVLVGTLYCGENEFDECVASIRRQRDVELDHFVLKDLPKREAHHRLYGTFMERATRFDCFVKVDADTVIEDERLLAKIGEVFREQHWVLELGIPLYDFFSDQLIPEMNAYRSCVRWTGQDGLFTDSSPVPASNVLHDDALAPAAIHCKNPSPFQAFHYGVHRGIKVIQPGRERRNDLRSWMHWTTLADTWRHFRRDGDVRLALAVLGAELAYRGTFQNEHFDYSHPFTRAVFKEYEGATAGAIAREVVRLRRSNWGLLPEGLRWKVLCLRHGARPPATRLIRRGLRRTARRALKPLRRRAVESSR